ncbi:phage holin [Staphylococcus capitis]|uniref:phage holin n=1 Tax=Staphylococcus capitis TaxID=29388 RepID=UPI002DB96A83|nr:phage holin [Staphylococcus capitis]MEB5628478.1 phage holin [Staphylococcus capitis]
MRNFLGINWHVRFNNPIAIIQLVVSAIVPVLVSLDVDWHTLTTWGALWNAFVDIISNPIAIIAILVGIYTSAIDGTTHGVSDSLMAKEYKKPNKE